jgi:peptidoglycan/LPS O-acetylase OafA/YrhL
MQTTPRNSGLDTLRAIAIALVVMEHYVLFVGGQPALARFGELGWVGVDLFFALSGYLIGNQVFGAMRSNDGFSASRFYARRALRTLPAFWFVLALYAFWPWFRAGRELPPLWQFLTFTQNINLEPGTAFSHAWSLCVEEQFYLLLPALALFIASMRRPLSWAWLAILAALVAGIVVRGHLWTTLVGDDPKGFYHYYKYIYYSSFCRFDELVAGVALALLKNYHAPLWQRMTARGNVALAAGAALTGVALYGFAQDVYAFGITVAGFPLLAAGFALMILAGLSGNSLLNKVRIPGAQSVALWSYSIYLLHKQVCILLIEPLKAQGILPGSWTSLAFSLAASLATGWLLYRLVEAPFMALRARLR